MKICYIAHPVGKGWMKAINLGKIKAIVRKINLTQAEIVPYYWPLQSVLSPSQPGVASRSWMTTQPGMAW